MPDSIVYYGINNLENLIAPSIAIVGITLIAGAAVFRRRIRRRTLESLASTLQPGEWAIARDSHIYPAPSENEIARWAERGLVLGSDWIFDAVESTWMPVYSNRSVNAVLARRATTMAREVRLDGVTIGCAAVVCLAVGATILLVDNLQSRAPHARSPIGSDELSPEDEVARGFRQYVGADAPVEIRREGWADSVAVYTRKSDFQNIPFPDRDGVVKSIANTWCAHMSHGWFTTLSVRDIRSGEVLTKCHCNTSPEQGTRQ